MNILATFAIALLASILYFTFFLSLSIRFKKHWYLNLAWSTSFLVIYLLSLAINRSAGFKQSFIFLMILLWSLRLSLYLIIRNINKEDLNYKNLNEVFKSKLLINIFIKLILPLAVASLLINSAAIIASTYNQFTRLEILDIAAAVIWILGFLLESIADLELFKFKSNTLNQDRILRVGLWNHTRHPNYLGEILQWSAICLAVITLPYGIVSLLSPLVLILWLFKFNILSKAENKLSNKFEYQEYKKETPILIPTKYIYSRLTALIQNLKKLRKNTTSI